MGEGLHDDDDINPDVGLVSEKKLRGMPNTTIMVAGNDPLRDDGLLFARKLHQNG